MGLAAVYQHLHLALFGSDHHRLAAHAADHVKRVHRPAPKRQLQHVFLHALFQRLFQIVGDLKEPVGRTQPADALVRPLVVVILHPEGGALPGLLEAVKLGALQKLVQNRLPEPLDFAQRHRMMRAGADVLYPVFFHLPLKAGLAAPVRVLTAVIGEHLFGHAVLGHSPAVALQHVFGRLAAIQPHCCDVTAVVVHEADQIRIAAGQPEGHNVALPQLVGTRSFEKPRFGRIFCRLWSTFFHQPFVVQGFVHGGRAGGDQKKPLQNIGDPSRAILRMLGFDLHHPLPDLPWHPGFAACRTLRLKAFNTPQPVSLDPSLNRMGADSELFSKQACAVLLLQVKPNQAQAKFHRVGQGAGFCLGFGRSSFLSRCHGLALLSV